MRRSATVALVALAACSCEDEQAAGTPAPTEQELLLGHWLLPGNGVGDRRYEFRQDGTFTLEVDSVGATDTFTDTGTFDIDDSHRLTLDYERQGVQLRPVETLYVDADALVIGGVLVAQDDPEGIQGTWFSWRVNQTGGAIAATTRTIVFGDGGVGSVTEVTERTTDGQAEEPTTSTASVQWAGEGPTWELTGKLEGTYTLRGDQLVNLQGAFTRPGD